MSKADEMFEKLGYEVSNSEFVEELNITTNTIVDNGYIKIIFYKFLKLYFINFILYFQWILYLLLYFKT